MEWKQLVKELVYILLRRLGNFLSGMETRGRWVWGGAFRGLGNFLSGMETWRLWKIGETVLGNFLSGMETPQRQGKRGYATALETSLVEWKRHKKSGALAPLLPLETSLVEWKR